jgi:hypothetical protein
MTRSGDAEMNATRIQRLSVLSNFSTVSVHTYMYGKRKRFDVEVATREYEADPFDLTNG